MLRSLLLIGFIAGTVPAIFMAPHVGLLVWTWISVMSPHRFVYGMGESLPYNLVIAVVTILAWLVSAEPKRFKLDLPMGIFLCLGGYYTLTTLTSLAPDLSFNIWDRTIKSMVLALLVCVMITNRVRVESMVGVIVI